MLLTLAQLSISLTFSFSGSTSMANFRFLMVYSCPQNTFYGQTAWFNLVSSHKNTAVEFEFLGHSGLCAIFCDVCTIRREKRASLHSVPSLYVCLLIAVTQSYTRSHLRSSQLLLTLWELRQMSLYSHSPCLEVGSPAPGWDCGTSVLPCPPETVHTHQ